MKIFTDENIEERYAQGLYEDYLKEQIKQKDKEIERLNNIINKIEKESYLGMKENTNNNDYSKGLYTAYQYINNKLKELKENNNEI